MAPHSIPPDDFFFTRTIVPENTGTILIAFEGSGFVIRYPVIAWIVAMRSDQDEAMYSTPVIGGSIGMPSTYCLELREQEIATAWVFVEDRWCQSLAEALEYGTQLAAKNDVRGKQASRD